MKYLASIFCTKNMGLHLFAYATILHEGRVENGLVEKNELGVRLY